MTSATLPAAPPATDATTTTIMGASSSTATGTSPADGTGLDALRGHVVVVDPGHDGGNETNPSAIARQVPDGAGTKECDTTGTETNSGYPEHAFTWDVSQRLTAILQAHGATVVLTHQSDSGVGPCVNERAAIGNQNPGAVGISIHADGGPAGARGFHVIRPAGIAGLNTAIVGPSTTLADDVRDGYGAGTGEPEATYVGANQGIVARNDLGGLNLSQIPKVFIECLNMRESTDAARAQDPNYRQQAAAAIAAGLAKYFAA